MTTILAIDAGFAHMGVVVADGSQILFTQTIHTEKASGKKGIRVADDDVERCQTLARFLSDVITQHKPEGAIVEFPSGGAQGARANRAMGMATAAVAAVLEMHRLPVEVVTPQAVKKASTGRQDGSKEQVEETVRQRFDWGKWMPKTKKDREHVTDAAGAILAAQNGTLMRALERMTAPQRGA